MVFLNNLSDFFNLIEPWLVFFNSIFQIIIFWLILRRQIKRDLLTSDIINSVLEKFRDMVKTEKEKPKKEKTLKVSPKPEENKS